eukprot:1713319-Rhodomonas_salina.1
MGLADKTIQILIYPCPAQTAPPSRHVPAAQAVTSPLWSRPGRNVVMSQPNEHCGHVSEQLYGHVTASSGHVASSHAVLVPSSRGHVPLTDNGVGGLRRSTDHRDLVRFGLEEVRVGRPVRDQH